MTHFARWPVLLLSLSLLAGVGLGSGLSGISVTDLLVLNALCALLGMVFAAMRYRQWLILPVIGLLVLLGIGRALVAERFDRTLSEEAELVEVRAVVVSAPEQIDTHERAYVDTEIDGQTVRLRARWNAQGEPIAYGTVLTLSGTARPPRQDLDFDERGFLLAHHAAGIIDVRTLSQTGEMQGMTLLRSIHTVRSWLLDRLHQALPPPQRQIVSGVLLGERSGLGEQLELAFRDTGTTHILVASGTNVSILAMILEGLLLAWLGRKLTAGILMLFLASFVVATGADASVIRASIFFAFIVIASLVGRRVHGPTLIAFVGLVMVLQSPWILLSDIAFQLSFAAILGLTTFSSWFEQLLPKWLLPNVLAPTLAAQLTTLPVLMYHFGQASLIAPLANLVAVPMVEGLMLGGMLSIIAPGLTVIPQATAGAVSGLLWVIQRLSQVSWAAITFPAGQWLLVALACVLIGCVWFVKQRMKNVDEIARDYVRTS